MEKSDRGRHEIYLWIVSFALACTIVNCGLGKNALQNNPTPQPEPSVSASATPTPTPAAEINNILFIVDSSGSMKAKAGKKTKMEAAKEVVSELIGELPSTVRAGLMVYGHRQKNDCKDVELLVPIGPVDKVVFSQKVMALQPLGETPISFSIRQAAETLKSQKGRKTIILISDGEESCKEDPCVVAAELKKADVDLRVHVVGFGIDTPAAKEQLHCIAESTGGIYKDAGNAAELKKTLEGMAAAAESTGDKGKLVSVIPDSNGLPLRYSIELYRSPAGERDQVINDALGLSQTVMMSDRVIEIPPGVYDIRYGMVNMPELWKRNVEIKAGEETRGEFPRFGRVRISLKDQNGNPLQLYGEVSRSSEPDKALLTINYSATTQELPEGRYNIKFWQVGMGGNKNGVEVRSGQETLVEMTIVRP